MDRFVPAGPGQALRGAFWRVARALYEKAPARGGPFAWPLPLLTALAGIAGRTANHLRLHGPTPAELQALFPEREPSALRRLAPRVTELEFKNRALLESVRRHGVEALASVTTADDSWRTLVPPAILVSFHLGALYALPGALACLPAPALVIREGPFYEPPAGHAVGFTRGGVEQRAAVLEGAVRQIRAGGFAILAIDRPEGAPTGPLPCLGRLIHFRRGAFALARITGAPVVPVTARWEGGRRVRVAAHEALPRPGAFALDPLAFETALARSAATWLECHLRASPEQLWLGSLFDLVDAPPS